MGATIGPYFVTTVKGILKPPAYGNTIYRQGGVNGVGVLFGGLLPMPQSLVTIVRVSSYGDYNTYQGLYRQLMRSSVNVVDQFGTPWTGVVVMGVEPFVTNDPLGYILNATWSLLVNAV